MTCEEALILISGHIDQENTEVEEAQLREHLEHCSECQSVLCTFEEIDAGVLSLKEEAPAALCDDVMAAIRMETAGKKHTHRRWSGLAVAAALIAVIGVGTLQKNETVAQDAVVPIAARSMPAEMDSTVVSTLEIDEAVDPQLLAEERQADVAVTEELLPEMEVCSCETLEDGSLLYCLEAADGAVCLSRLYGIALYQPVAGAASDVSYALLVP